MLMISFSIFCDLVAIFSQIILHKFNSPAWLKHIPVTLLPRGIGWSALAILEDIWADLCVIDRSSGEC